MPGGPCGGPDCTSQGFRRGKGEHADKWCCTKSACRKALGIIAAGDKRMLDEADGQTSSSIPWPPRRALEELSGAWLGAVLL